MQGRTAWAIGLLGGAALCWVGAAGAIISAAKMTPPRWDLVVALMVGGLVCVVYAIAVLRWPLWPATWLLPWVHEPSRLPVVPVQPASVDLTYSEDISIERNKFNHVEQIVRGDHVRRLTVAENIQDASPALTATPALSRLRYLTYEAELTLSGVAPLAADRWEHEMEALLSPDPDLQKKFRELRDLKSKLALLHAFIRWLTTDGPPVINAEGNQYIEFHNLHLIGDGAVISANEASNLVFGDLEVTGKIRWFEEGQQRGEEGTHGD